MELVKYDAACYALAECANVDEVKDIRDKAIALKVYARQANDKELERQAAKIRIRAERRLGEMLIEQKATVGMNQGAIPGKTGTKTEPVLDPRPTLADMGISKKLSSNAQMLAGLDDQEFDTLVETSVERTADPAATLKKQKNTEDRKQKEANEVATSNCASVVIHGDCLDVLPGLPDIDLLLTDPPYFTDGNFTEHIAACLQRVKRTGQAYVFASADPFEIAAYVAMNSGHMELTQILVWCYNNTGQRQPNERYTSNFQVALYYRGPDAPPINKPADGTHQYACQTINAPDGRIGDRYHKWQKPVDLMSRLISNSSNPGDFVFDPFVGSGSTVVAAASLGRNATGCDIDIHAIEICVSRGCSRVI